MLLKLFDIDSWVLETAGRKVERNMNDAGLDVAYLCFVK